MRILFNLIAGLRHRDTRFFQFNMKHRHTIDYSAGILLEKKYGDSVREGETIAVLYASHEELFGPAMEKFLASCTLGKQMPEPEPLIFARISDAGVERRTIEEKIP